MRIQLFKDWVIHKQPPDSTLIRQHWESAFHAKKVREHLYHLFYIQTLSITLTIDLLLYCVLYSTENENIRCHQFVTKMPPFYKQELLTRH